VRQLSGWILVLIASPVGLAVFAALDSTMFVSFPGGIDAGVIVLAARGGFHAWSAALLATAGSVGGAALTFWMGAKLGEHGLDRYMSSARLDRVRRRIHNSGALGMAVLDLIPPPFPFTPFILAAGALDVDVRTFFGTLTICRLLRFGLEAALASMYGSVLLTWFDSELFHDLVIAVGAAGVALTILTIAKLLTSKSHRGARDLLRSNG
jgi:membrane protein YqaA with SNARE-associated domain